MRMGAMEGTRRTWPGRRPGGMLLLPLLALAPAAAAAQEGFFFSPHLTFAGLAPAEAENGSGRAGGFFGVAAGVGVAPSLRVFAAADAALMGGQAVAHADAGVEAALRRGAVEPFARLAASRVWVAERETPPPGVPVPETSASGDGWSVGGGVRVHVHRDAAVEVAVLRTRAVLDRGTLVGAPADLDVRATRITVGASFFPFGRRPAPPRDR